MVMDPLKLVAGLDCGPSILRAKQVCKLCYYLTLPIVLLTREFNKEKVDELNACSTFERQTADKQLAELPVRRITALVFSIPFLPAQILVPEKFSQKIGKKCSCTNDVPSTSTQTMYSRLKKTLTIEFCRPALAASTSLGYISRI